MACSEPGFVRIGFAKRLSLEVPDYLELASGMHPEHSLQMSNVYDGVYLLARFDTLKEGEHDLEAYYLNTFQQVLPGVPVPYPDTIRVDGHLGLHVQTEGSFANRNLIYDLSLIQTQQYLYQILLWTEKKEAEDYLMDFERIRTSFQEL